mgnify:CR=1 FL=1
MENKYYIPTIDEFYVGFEHEFMNGDRWEDNIICPRDLITETSGGDPCENYFEEIYKGLRDVRVKYLDKEDIESLGWEHIGSGWYNLKVVPGSLGYWNYVRLRKWQKNELFIRGYRNDPSENEDTENEMLFTGNIKNKSELKKLMKQLNINE